jgi:anti-sigma B factor antagonist
VSDTPAPAPVTIEKVGSALVARPQVKLLDEASFKALKRAIEEAGGADAAVPLIVLDLSRVAILPSLALGRLVELATACKSRQQTLKLAALQPQIQKVFSVTRLDTVFPIAETVDAAVAGNA